MFVDECELTDVFYNAGIIPKNTSDGRYYYTDVFNYDCDFGYIKSESSKITCQADRTWSTTPKCSNKTGKLPKKTMLTIFCISGFFELFSRNSLY